MSKGSMKQRVGLIVVPLLALSLLVFGDLDPERPEVTRMAAVAVLMAGWWVTEAIPIPATALLPVALFPLLGILEGKQTAAVYFNQIIFLFIGGFIFALAMQRWELHRRIAVRIVLMLGTSPRRMVLGFMAATWFLSMWISNTASTMMMVPMALAVVLKFRERNGNAAIGRFSVGLLLGVAYSASIGGLSTLIGTPPNLSLARILEIVFPDAPSLSFAGWFFFALPLSAVFLVIAWWLLCRLFLRGVAFSGGHDDFRREHDEMGPMSFEQRAVGALFIMLVFAWMFRADIDLFGVRVPGWSGLFPRASFIDDGTVAISIALLLFLIPSRRRRAERLMDWETAVGVPWGLVLLFGGGFALASGFKESGLSEWLGVQLAAMEGAPPLLLVVATCAMLTFLTELTSNTATTEMALPVLASLAVAIETDPLLLMVPATLSASCAFMLPVATAPNAIVFGTGEVRMADMMRGGILLNLIGIVLITAAVYLLGTTVLGIDPGVVPDWAQPH
ncbi:MAG: SLC13 family permease [Planctomycetota bacterium]|jgi:sodium-dependent dicarboxylate transporter 2/3/5